MYSNQRNTQMIAVSRIFPKTVDRTQLYFNLPGIVGNQRIAETDAQEGNKLAGEGGIVPFEAGVQMRSEFEYRTLTEKKVIRAYFKADPDMKKACQDRIRKETEEYNSSLKKSGRWFYFTERRTPAYEAVRSMFDMPADLDVYLELDSKKMNTMVCGVCGNYSLSGRSRQEAPCSHIAAALLLLDRHLIRYNPGDETNNAGEQFMSAFQKSRKGSKAHPQEEKKAEILLEPRLSIQEERLDLSFKIGTNRMFVVKDLKALTDKAEHQEVMTLGKTASLDFSSQTFTPAAADYYQLIREEYSAYEYSREKLSEVDPYFAQMVKMRGEIRLTGERLDRFFDLAVQHNHGKVGIKSSAYGSAKSMFSCMVGGKQISLKIAPIPGRKFTGIRITGYLPAILTGKNSQYLLDEEHLSLHRLEEGQGADQFLQSFLKFAGEEPVVDITIGVKNLQQFYYQILPEMEKSPSLQLTIDQEAKIREHIFPKPEFAFYLDMEEDTAVCRGEVAYAGQTEELRRFRDSDFPLKEYRDVEQETAAIDKIQEFFVHYDAENQQFVSGEEEDLYDLLKDGIPALMELGEVHCTDALMRHRINSRPSVKIGVNVEGNLLDLKIKTEDMSVRELAELLNSYRRKKRYYKLTNGSYVPLENNEVIETLDQVVSNLGLSLKELSEEELKLPIYRALYLDKMLETHDEIAYDRQKGMRRLIRNLNSVKEADFDVPEQLAPIMRSYQKNGYKWMRTLSEFGFNGILADDMGLGKTLQMISVLKACREEKPEEKRTSLIVCPSSLVYNWQEECRRFAPDLSVGVVAGTASIREDLLKNHWTEFEVLITSYDLLKRDIRLYEGKEFFYQVIDEAQYIKNPKAAVTKAVKIINSIHKMALTGTPIENRLSELWSIFDYLMPGFLYTYDQFRGELEQPIVKFKEEAATERLKTMISPFILRRLKTDVLKDLPDKVEEVRFAHFEKDQQKLYDAQVLHMKNFLQEADSRDKIKILAEITRVRQICCDPGLLFEKYRGESAKRQAALELIESAMDGGHKILLFSQFTSMLELLEKDLVKQGISYYKITGATPKEERLRLVHSFNEDETPLFLISLKAGGTGLNLTGADVVIHYDPWWNLAAQNQATDRAHRIGQTNKVTVYKLIAKDTIEEKILQLQEAKRDLADAVMNGETTSLTSLSKEELMELFG